MSKSCNEEELILSYKKEELLDCAVEESSEVISSYSNVKKKYEKFIDSVEIDKFGRVVSCLGDIAFVMNRARYTEAINSDSEEEVIKLSMKLKNLELGIEFLTDYLNGDIYFKVNSETDNLDMARKQFELVMGMEKN